MCHRSEGAGELRAPARRGGGEREFGLREGPRPRGAQWESRLTSGAGRAAARCSRGRGDRDTGAERKPGIPEGLVPTAPAAASAGARALPGPLAACRTPGRGGTPQETCRRACPGEPGLRTHPIRTLRESLLMTLRGSRTLSDAWGTVRPRTGCREFHGVPGEPKLTDGEGRRGHRGGGGGDAGGGGVDPEFIWTERSSDLFAGKRSSWILPAPDPALGGSALPEPGLGTVSWRTCLAFSSAHSYPGRFSFPFVPLWGLGVGEAYSGRLAPHSGRDKLNFKGRGLTFCLLHRSHPRTAPSPHCCLRAGPTPPSP